METPDPAGWAVVVPLKRLELAKTRLSRFAGSRRADLALAFAADTVIAVLGCAAVGSVVVVTDDEAGGNAMRDLGAVVLPDQPDAGLNAALVHGAQHSGATWPGRPVAAVTSDLAALRSAELDIVLTAALARGTAFVADAEGIGTTVLAATDPGQFEPRFGRRSRAEHRAAGVAEIIGGSISSVRRDVDTPAQLYDAERLGVGARTTLVLLEIRGSDESG
jgi:2-phospho-L-lactate/phosphoenolpyruvate guanylyltransferase